MKMFCFVTLPGGVVLEVEVDSKAKGQECLDKICEKIGVIEVDYFGLQYGGTKGEQLWLNMRNRISRQLSGQAPYRLQLRVKFFVQPHYLLQQTARHMFYLHIKDDLLSGRWKLPEKSVAVSVFALIAQAQFGDYNRTEVVRYNLITPKHYQGDNDFLANLVQDHSSLEGMTQECAETKMLKTVAELVSYGVEYHVVKNGTDQTFHLGVGPEGIAVYDKDWQLTRSVAYPTIQMATHAGKCLFLHTFQDDGSTTILGVKLVSQKAANGLYRCITEMHSFYRCDTVRNTVSAQFSRDIKGTLASLFNENTTLGKKYVFDIQRTCREAYDHARRVLYQAENSLSLPNTPVHRQETREHNSLVDGQTTEKGNANIQEECQFLKEKLERIEDALLCRVCMDADINTAFCPCGHLVCCSGCAEHVDCCPLCRAQIEQTQHVFMPNWKAQTT